jgi:hypothetical protein
MVQQQAAMLSYNDTFRWLAGMFLLMLPLLIADAQGEEGQSGYGTLTETQQATFLQKKVSSRNVACNVSVLDFSDS